MARTPTRAFLAAIALVLVAGALAPVAGASTSGDDAEGDVTVTDRSEPEPPRNLTLTVRFVANGTGEPVADLPVQVANRWQPADERKGAHDSWERTTDGDGTVTLNASRGPVWVSVEDPDWKELRAGFHLDGNLTVGLPMRATDAELASISGSVGSPDGDPIPNASVEVDPVRDCEEKRCPVQAEAERSTSTVDANGTEVDLTWSPHDRNAYLDVREDGSYEVTLPEDTYRIEAQAPDHLRSVAEVEAGAGEETAASFELTPVPDDTVTIRGVVRDAATGDPIEGAIVTVENTKWGSHAQTVTGADGAYEMSTKPGHVLVEVDAEPRRSVCVTHDEETAHSGGGAEASVAEPRPDCEPQAGSDQPYLPRTRGLQVAADSTRNVSLALQPEDTDEARIQGWVLEDGTGDPLPNATVYLRNEETGDWGRAEVDGNGSFAADVPAGYHTVRVRAPGHVENATNVAVAEDATAEVVLRSPAGEDHRHQPCCYAYESSEPTHGDAGSGTSEQATASEAGGPAERTSGPIIQGGPGELGPYETSSSGEEPARSDTPAPGSAALVAALTGAAALGRRLRGR
jgi:hypothetical protein